MLLPIGTSSAQNITTVAGNGDYAFSGDGGPATSASLNWPYGIAVDGSGNLYIADQLNNRIRKVAAGTGIITTVAGNGGSAFSGDGGPATSASLDRPNGVFVDGSGNLYIADSSQRIRKVAAGTGTITTVAGNGNLGFSGDGGPATSASLNWPYGISVDGSGNIYIADQFNNRIRKVAAGTGIITTVAGDGTGRFSGDGGPATNASLNRPWGVSVDGSGDLYIADQLNNRIRKVAVGTGIITTVAGGGLGGDGGPAIGAYLWFPVGISVDGSGDLYIANLYDNRIRKVAVGTGIITTVAGANENFGFSGDGGPATSARFHNPVGISVDGSGNIYIADLFNNRIRKVNSLYPGLVFSTQPAVSVSGVTLTVQPVVRALNVAGSTDLTFNETISLSLASGEGALSGTLTMRAINGVATFTDVVYTATVDGENFSLSANDQDEVGTDLSPVASISVSSEVYVVPTRLVFTTQPEGSVSGAAMRTQPVVKATDSNNVVAKSFSGTITLSLASGGGSLSGTLTATAVNGVATFTDVAYTATLDGESFGLQATSGGLTAASSSNLTADVVATQLVFTTQPSPLSATSGVLLDFSVDPVVEARDQYGLRDTGFTGTVVLAETGAGSATFTNNSVSAVAGVATFTGLTTTYTATADGESFGLQATSGGLTAASSSNLTADVVATQLVFATQPGHSISGLALSTQPVVRAIDGNNLTDVGFAETVTLALASGGGSLSGTLTATALNGVATFTDVAYTATANGESFALSANDQDGVGGDLSSVTSNSVVTIYHAGVPGAPEVTGITPGNTQLSVEFMAPASDGGALITNYEYSISTDNGESWGDWVTPDPAVTESPLVITGFDSGTTYGIKLRAVNSEGAGSASNSMSRTTTAISWTSNQASPIVIKSPKGGNEGGAGGNFYLTNTGNQALNVISISTIGNYRIGYIEGRRFTYDWEYPNGGYQRLVVFNGNFYDEAVTTFNFTPRTSPTSGNGYVQVGADIAFTILYRTPDTAGSFDGSVVVTTQELGAQTVMVFHGTAVEAPVSTDDAVVTLEGTPMVLAIEDFGEFYSQAPDSYDQAQDDQLTSVMITTLPATGSLEYDTAGDGSGWTAVTVDQEVAAEEIAAGRLRFVPEAAGIASPYAAIGFKVAGSWWTYSDDAYTLTVNVISVTVPGAPTITGITPGNQQLSLAFTAPVSTGGAAISNYAYSTDGGVTWVVRNPVSTTSPLVITGLTNGTAYAVQLRAINSAGQGAATASTSATPVTVPGAPVISGITPGDQQLSVAFTAPASDGGSPITDYQYARDDLPGMWISAGTTVSPVVITGLTNGTTYTVQIRAVSGEVMNAIYGTASNPMSGTPVTVPDAPAISGITSGDQQLSLAFTAPASDGGSAIVNYAYSTDDGTSWTLRNPAATTSPLVITGLTNGTTYVVKLRAVNSEGAGAASNSVNGTPATDNAGATFTLNTPTELNDVGPGESVIIGISAANLVNVKQAMITLEVVPEDAFDLAGTSFTPGTAFTNAISPGVELAGAGQVRSGFAMLGGTGFSGDADLGTFTFSGFQVPISEVQVIVHVIEISVGPNSTNRTVFDAEALNLDVAINPAEEPGDLPAISPYTQDFGSVVIDSVVPWTLTVTNSGTALLEITGFSLDNWQGVSYMPFSPFSVGPGETHDVTTVYVTLSSTGAWERNLYFTGNVSAPEPVILRALGIVPPPPVLWPSISVVPAALNLGPHALDTPYTARFSVVNTSSSVLSISDITSSDGQFVVTPAGFTVQPGRTQLVSVIFTPIAVGGQSATLTIHNNSATPATTVAVSGIGLGPVISVVPVALEMNNVSLGASRTTIFNVANNSRASLAVSNIETSDGQFVASFAHFNVLPGHTQPVAMTYTPTEVGTSSAFLTIYSNDPLTPTTQVALSGTAIAGSALVDFASDGQVGIEDFLVLTVNFGLNEDQEHFDPVFDLNSDGQVEYGDLFIFADNFGRTADQIVIPPPGGNPGPFENAGAVFTLGTANAVGVGPNQEIQIPIVGHGLVGVKQFEFAVEVTPSDAISLEESRFDASGAMGLQLIPEGTHLRAGGVVLGNSATPLAGVEVLGTIVLHTSSTFNSSTPAIIRLTRISVGPTSIEHDVFTDLNLEVKVNQSSVRHHRQAVFPGEPLDIFAQVEADPAAVQAVLRVRGSETAVATVELNDAGISPDEAADDQVYSGRWMGGAAGEYAIDLYTDDGTEHQVHSADLDFVSVTHTILSVPSHILVAPGQTAQARVPLLLEDNGSGYLNQGFRAALFSLWGAESGLGTAQQPALSFQGTTLGSAGLSPTLNYVPKTGGWQLVEALASASLLQPGPGAGQAQRVMAYIDLNLTTGSPTGTFDLGLSGIFDESESGEVYTSGTVELGRGDVDFDGRILPFDAALILMHTIGLIDLIDPGNPINDAFEQEQEFTLPPGGEITGDVTGNGRLSPLDAAHILQRTIGLISHFPAEEGYYRLWDPPATWWNPPANAVSSKLVAVTAAPKLHKVVRLGEPRGSGEQVVVPVTIDQMKGVLAGNLTLHYPAGGWQVAEVRKGELTAGYMLAHNTTGEELQVAFAGAQAPEGSGKLFEVVFSKVGGQQRETGTLNLSEVKLNDDAIDATIDSPAAGKLLDLPKEFALQPNYPNPFNPSTTIKYDLPVGAAVELTVYDLLGQQVRQLQTGRQEAGRHQLEWDGRDDLGKEVASGMYMYQLVTPEHTLVRKMMLLR